MSKKHFLQGALILSIAAILSRVLGLFYRIPLQQLAGDHGLAMYQAVYPLFTTILVLVVSGIPVVLSKLISEQVALGNEREEKRIIRHTITFISMIGVIVFLLLFFGSSLIAKWIGWPEVSLSIKAVSFALLIIPFLSVLRGVFYGYQNITPAAASQVVEQFFRVITILTLTFLLVRAELNLEVVIAGATFGSVVGVSCSLIYLFIKYLHEVRKKNRHNRAYAAISKTGMPLGQWDLFRKIFFFTIAVSISALMVPLFGLADSFTGINLLHKALGSQTLAQEWFGIYSRGMPFVQLTTIFATSLALSLVPKIAEAGVVQNNRDISHSTYLALKITILLGLPASVGLALLSPEINILFYGDDRGSTAMAILALSSFFLTLAITAVAILQGMGKIYGPAVFLILAILSKILLNIWFIPLLSISGAAAATFVSYLCLLLLNMLLISRNVPAFVGWRRLFMKPLLATAVMAAGVYAGDHILRDYFLPHPSRLETAILIALLIALGVLVYGVVILLSREITRSELLRIPKVGSFLVVLFSKLRLVREN